MEFSKLPNEIVLLILEKTAADPTTLSKFGAISKKYGQLARRVKLPYFPSIRLQLRLREDPQRVHLHELRLRPTYPGPVPPRPPQNPPPTFMLSFPDDVSTLFQKFITLVGGSILTRRPTPATLDIAISFPDRPDCGIFVKWKGVFRSRTDCSFAFALADDVHPSHLPPLPPIMNEYGHLDHYPTAVGNHFLNFICMATLVKSGGEWFNSLDQVSISYARRMGKASMIDDVFLLSQELRYSISRNVVRAWPAGSLRNINGMNFQQFVVGAIKITCEIHLLGRPHDVVNEAFDRSEYEPILMDAFADDPLLCDAISQALATTVPRSNIVQHLGGADWGS